MLRAVKYALYKRHDACGKDNHYEANGGIEQRLLAARKFLRIAARRYHLKSPPDNHDAADRGSNSEEKGIDIIEHHGRIGGVERICEGRRVTICKNI